MTFRRDSVKKIKAGRKTATTRVSGQYQEGGEYTINPYPAKNPKARFDPAVGYIQILKRREVPLKGLALPVVFLVAHARQVYREEGFENPRDCYARFKELRLHRQDTIYYYEFKYLGKDKPPSIRGKRKQ